jgi:hypothetical protein
MSSGFNLKRKRVYADEIKKWCEAIEHVNAYVSALLKKHGVRDHAYRDADNYTQLGATVVRCSSFLGALKHVGRTYDGYAASLAAAGYFDEKARIVVKTAAIFRDIIDDSIEIVQEPLKLDDYLELDDAQVSSCVEKLTECTNMLSAVIEENDECLSKKHVHVEPPVPKQKRTGVLSWLTRKAKWLL